MNRRAVANSLAVLMVTACTVILSSCLAGVQCPPPSGSGAVRFGHPLENSSATTCSSTGGGGTGGGGGGNGTCVAGLTPNAVLFSLDASGNILEYAISAVNGDLMLMCNTGVTVAGGLPVVSSNNFLYVLDPKNLQIFGFSIAHGRSGALTPVPGQPFKIKVQQNETISSSFAFMEADPLGRFLFITNEQDSLVHVFSISSTQSTLGALSEATNSPFAVSNPAHLVVDTSGNFAYVADQTDGQILIFSLNSTGQLTAGSPSSFLLDSGVDAPHFLIEHPSLPVLYSANNGSIAALTVDRTSGSLTSVPGSPFSTLGLAPDFMTIDSSGGFIYANDFTSLMQIFGDVLDTNTGALTGSVSGSPFPLPTGTTSVLQVLSNITGPNVYAFVTSSTSGLVANFAITIPGGALTVPSSTPTAVAQTNLAIANIE